MIHLDDSIVLILIHMACLCVLYLNSTGKFSVLIIFESAKSVQFVRKLLEILWKAAALRNRRAKINRHRLYAHIFRVQFIVFILILYSKILRLSIFSRGSVSWRWWHRFVLVRVFLFLIHICFALETGRFRTIALIQSQNERNDTNFSPLQSIHCFFSIELIMFHTFYSRWRFIKSG